MRHCLDQRVAKNPQLKLGVLARSSGERRIGFTPRSPTPSSINTRFASRKKRGWFVALTVASTQWEGLMRNNQLLELVILVIKVMILITEIMLIH